MGMVKIDETHVRKNGEIFVGYDNDDLCIYDQRFSMSVKLTCSVAEHFANNVYPYCSFQRYSSLHKMYPRCNRET